MAVTGIVPCLGFESEAEAAARFYTALLPGSEMGAVTRAGPGTPLPEGAAMMVAFTLAGQPYRALNGVPKHQPSEAVSFMVQCETQAEIDRLWTALTADGGAESMCGWLRDRWGFSWQILPAEIERLLSGPHADKVMAAVMTMKKLDIAALEAAARS